MSSRTRNAAPQGTLDLPADDEKPSASKQATGPLAGLTEPEPEARARAAALQSSLARGRASVHAFAAALAAHRPPLTAACAPSAHKLGRARAATAEPAEVPSSTSSAASTPEAPGTFDASGTPWAPGPSRQYPVAWALWGRGTQTSGVLSANDAHAHPEDPATTPQAAPPPTTELAVRPPPGRPTVRGPVRTRPAPTAAPASTLLAETTDAALLVASPDGAQSMQLSFRDDVFAQLQCNIEVGPRGVVATFYAEDVNTRRLLAAESDALRLRLEARGLSVAAVRVAASGEAPAVPAAWAQVAAPESP